MSRIVATVKVKKMVQVRVRFYGHIRDVVGESALETVVAEGSTVRDLFDSLMERFGEAFRQRVLTSKGELEANVQLFVGDTQVRSLHEPLTNGQEPLGEVKVFVLSATAGG